MIYVIEKHLPGLQNIIEIFDEDGELAYYVDSKLFLGERKITLYSEEDDKVVAEIQRIIPSFEPKFQILIDGVIMGEFTKEFSFLDARVHIISEYGAIVSEGDIINLDFKLKNVEGALIALVDDQMTEDEDTYGVEIADDADDEFILCLLLIMDVLFSE
jgi:uncharacterized protein YxjI